MVICEGGTSLPLRAEQRGNGGRGQNVVGVGVGNYSWQFFTQAANFFFQVKDAVIEQLMKNQEQKDLEDQTLKAEQRRNSEKKGKEKEKQKKKKK